MAVKDLYGNLYSEKKKEKNLYSTYSTATPRTQNTLKSNERSTQQNSGWSAGQSVAPAQSNAVQKPKREKSPSELGEEVVRIMLEDFKEEERQKQAAFDRAAQYGGGAVKARKTAEKQKTAQYGNAAAQLGGQPSYSDPSVTKPAAGNQKATSYGGATPVQYSNPAAAAKTAAAYNAASYASPAAAKPAVKRREMTPSELGEAAAAWMLVDEGIMDPKVLEEYLASFEEPAEEAPAQTFTAGVGRSDIIGPNANANEAAARPQATPEELMLAAAPDFAAAGIDPSVLQAGLSLGHTAKQLWDDTHIAEGMSAPLYLVEKGLSGTAMGLEGAWNGIVDFARAGVNADLAQQAQQAQQFSFLGGPYQQYADSIADTSQAIQEVLPEAAENLRSHKAAEYAQQLDELYEAGGYLKLLGDIVSAGGQTLPTVGINLATGGTMGLPYLFVSAEGNAAAEARAGGADEDLAYLYGLSSAGLEVATEKISDGLPGMKGGWIDNWLSDYAETNTGRAVLKAAKDAAGEGFEEFASGMVQPYLAKMWNGDERDFWQTLGESTPDALYDGFIGMANGFGLSAPGNYSNIQNARIVDAALDTINHGGTLSDAQLIQAYGALQELTDSWGDPKKSEWSRNAIGQWDNALSGYSGSVLDSGQKLPLGFLSLPMFDSTEQNGQTNAAEASAQAGQPAAAAPGMASSPAANNIAATENSQGNQLHTTPAPVSEDLVARANVAVDSNVTFAPAVNNTATQNGPQNSAKSTYLPTVENQAVQTNTAADPNAVTAANNAAMTENGRSNLTNLIVPQMIDNQILAQNEQSNAIELASKLIPSLNANDTTAKMDQQAEQNNFVPPEANEMPDTFHSDSQIVEIENEQNYRAIERGEASVFCDGRHPEINAQRITTYKTPVYVSENATIKPKTLHQLNLYTEAAMKRYGISMERKPTIVIVSEEEMPRAWGRYDAVNNVVYYSQLVESPKFVEPQASVEYHEMIHMMQAEEFRQKGWVITNENYGQYMQELCRDCKKRLDAAGIKPYNMEKEISPYAYRSYLQGRFDEVEAEWRSRDALRVLGETSKNGTTKREKNSRKSNGTVHD